MSSAWDRKLALRAAALAGITALFTLLIIAATDEGAPFTRRLGMASALGPIAGAVGALAAIRIAAGRGELRALAAIGVEPARAVRGAILGGVLLAAIGPALAASGVADLGGLFPRPAAARVWIADEDGMTELTQGLRIERGGAVARVAATGGEAPALPAGSTVLTVIALAIAAAGVPLWTAAAAAWGGSAGPAARLRVVVGVAALVLAIVAFQAVAAGRLPAAALVGAPLILFLDGAAARYRARRP
jgi:hypothetical protein